MDNFAYLNEIAQSNRPVKNPAAQGSFLNKSMVIKIVVGGAVLFFLLMAVGALLSGLKNRTVELTRQVYLRTTNLNSVLVTYNPAVKNSSLRSTGLSLAGILTNATTQLGKYLNPTGDDGASLQPAADVVAEETTTLNGLNTALESAKLNGVLDRTYANQIGWQVSLLLALVSELEERSDDAGLLSVLQNYRTSLETIHQSFESYQGIGS